MDIISVLSVVIESTLVIFLTIIKMVNLLHSKCHSNQSKAGQVSMPMVNLKVNSSLNSQRKARLPRLNPNKKRKMSHSRKLDRNLQREKLNRSRKQHQKPKLLKPISWKKLTLVKWPTNSSLMKVNKCQTKETNKLDSLVLLFLL